jgi:hypothetical protein
MPAAVAQDLDAEELAFCVEADEVVDQTVIARENPAVGLLEFGAQAGLDHLAGLCGSTLRGRRNIDGTAA